MTEARVLLAFGALLVLALWFAVWGVSASLAPLCAVSGTALFFSLLGSFGLLALAGWVFYAAMAAGLAALAYRTLVQKKPLPALSYGFWLFAAAGLGLLLLLWAKQPMFLSFDEFSFWGTAAKLAKTYNAFHTTAPVGWGWVATYPPGLVSLGYFVQFLGRGFSEWQVYAAYDWLTLAAVAALLAPFEKKQWNIAFPVAVLGLLVPFVFRLYGTPQQVASPYLDSMGDTPMGLLFGAALACWFGAGQKGWRALLPLCLCLALLTLTKDMAFALALVVCVLVLLDVLLAKREKGVRFKARLLPALGCFGLCLAATVLPFAGWSAHLSATRGVSKLELGGASQLGMLQLPLAALREWLSPQPGEKFREVMAGMPRLFWQAKVSLFGSGLVVILLIAALLGFAALITRQAALRRRIAVFGVFSFLGYLAYMLLIALTYIYIFRAELMFTDYERYMMPYYMGWFLAALALLGQAARDTRFAVEGKAALLALCGGMCLLFAVTVPPVYTVLGFHPDEYAERRAEAAAARAVARRLPEDSLTYLVSQDDNGKKWFTYCYELLPRQMDFGNGGGRMGPKGSLPADTPYFYPMSRRQWETHLLKTGVTHVFVDDADTLFRDEYGPLFTDGMAGYFERGVRLYAAEPVSGGLRLRPVEG